MEKKLSRPNKGGSLYSSVNSKLEDLTSGKLWEMTIVNIPVFAFYTYVLLSQLYDNKMKMALMF